MKISIYATTHTNNYPVISSTFVFSSFLYLKKKKDLLFAFKVLHCNTPTSGAAQQVKQDET